MHTALPSPRPHRRLCRNLGARYSDAAELAANQKASEWKWLPGDKAFALGPQSS